MTTPRDTFDQQYLAGTAYAIDGDLLNKQHRVLEGVALRGGAAFADTTQGQPNGPPAGVMGVAIITDAANTCGTSDGEIQPPCANVNKYWAHFRYYDTDTNRWIDYDEDLRLDASGYWEGVVTGGFYTSDASKSPTSGPGYGAIPAFAKGDAVPAFYDTQRGWLVPIMPPPADDPGGELYTSSVVGIPEQGVDPNNSVVCMLEVLRPGDLDWVARQAMCWNIPPVNDYEWVDTRSMFVVFKAPSDALAGTFVRLRIGKHASYSLDVWEARMRLFGIGRAGSASYEKSYGVRQYIGAGEGRVLNAGWDLKTSIPGRYKDSPTFNLDGGGNLEITYLDPQDCWFIGAQVEITIANEPGSLSLTSLSSKSSSTYYSRSSLSWSSRSTQESTRSWTSLSSQTSASLTSTSSTQLQSTSTSETSTRTDVSSLTSGSDYCTVTLVSDVECDAGGHVLRVCYRTIGFPKDPSKNSCSEQIGPEFCYPCQPEDSTSSSQSITGQTSTTSTHLKSTSSQTTPSSTSSQSNLSSASSSSQSVSSFASDICTGHCIWEWTGAAWSSIADTCAPVAGISGPAPACTCLPPLTDGTFAGQIIDLACNESY